MLFDCGYDNGSPLVMPSSSIAELLQKALTLHRAGAVAAAAAAYGEVLRGDPSNSDAHYYLAMISCQSGRFAEGADLARKLLTGRRCLRSSRSSRQTTSNLPVSSSTRRSGVSSPRGLRIQGRRPISIAGTPSNAMRHNPLSACIGFG